jgi:hypothetical protein
VKRVVADPLEEKYPLLVGASVGVDDGDKGNGVGAGAAEGSDGVGGLVRHSSIGRMLMGLLSPEEFNELNGDTAHKIDAAPCDPIIGMTFGIPSKRVTSGLA